MLSDAGHRLRAIFSRDRVERELADELQFHLEHEAEKLIARGVPRADALRQARIALGGVEQVKEECRDARGVSAVESVMQDLRSGVRSMRRAPVFAFTAILTLALSTASLATVFTLGNTMLYRLLPVERAEELVALNATRDGTRTDGLVAYRDYVIFRNGTRT